MYYILLIIISISIYLALPFLIKIILKKRFLKKVKESGKVYLTFDDGPNKKNTIKILNILKENNVKATFFLIGIKIKHNKEIVKRIIDEGHEIGNHTYHHKNALFCNPFLYIYDLFFKSNEIIKKEYNINNNYFRPPFGKFNIITLFFIIIKKQKTIFWNLDTKDYKYGQNKNDKVEFNIQEGSIILLHDGRINNNNKNINITINYLRNIIKYINLKKLNTSTFKEIYK